MIFSLFYQIFLSILCLAYIPKLTYLYFSRNKYKTSLKQRFGFDFPVIDKKNKPLVWVHAVSVGETRAVAAFCFLLKTEYTLIVSSITETGHAEARRSIPFADYHVYLPVDLKCVIKPIVKKVNPEFVIISETDLWFEFLKTAKENGAKTVVVNGKISEKSFKRLKIFNFFAKHLYSLIDLFVVQNTHYKERLSLLGVAGNKIKVTGNLKFDEDYLFLKGAELDSWKEKLGISDKSEVLVIGSTHDPEENIILDALDKIWPLHPMLKVVIVPRHPERFDTIEKELILRELPFSRLSKCTVCVEKIVLVDAMGLLRQCYQVATLAFVGGSFTKNIGGHNILEPLGYSVPVLFGPYMHSQPDLLKYVLEYKAGVQIKASDIAQEIDLLLKSNDKRQKIAMNGLKLISDFKGSTKTTFQLCEDVFKGFKNTYKQ
jgi:3-deoxy-D-manno-octulosonic-acid transferase